jgi:hypothetical protein
MMRPGTNVKRPAISSAPTYSPIMVERWRDTEWLCAAQTPSGSIASVKIDSRWMGLQLLQMRNSWIQNELMATISISAAHV